MNSKECPFKKFVKVFGCQCVSEIHYKSQHVMRVVVSTHTRSLAFISAGLKNKKQPLQDTCDTKHGPWLQRKWRKDTNLSPAGLCIRDSVGHLNAWSSGRRVMHRRGGHSWDKPTLIWKQKTFYSWLASSQIRICFRTFSARPFPISIKVLGFKVWTFFIFSGTIRVLWKVFCSI